MESIKKHNHPNANPYSEQVATGFPSPAMDYLHERIDLNKEFVKHPLSTFLFENNGNSLINAFIPHKGRMLIDRALKAKNGDLVLVVLNGEFLVRRLLQNEHKCFLLPENSKFKEIEITKEMQMEIWGVVSLIIIDPKDL